MSLLKSWFSEALNGIWQIFICSIKSPQCTDKCSKKNFSTAIFLPRVLTYQKRQISLPVGYKTAGPKTGDWQRLWRHFRTPSLPAKKQISPTVTYFLINNALLCRFLVNWLAHNKKKTEKSVFRKAWSPEMTSQSFPVSYFSSRGFVPHRKWNLTLVHWGDLIEQIKKSVAFDKAFPDAWRVAGGEICMLESFCWFEVRSHVENGFFLKSFALIYACIQERSLCIWNFSREYIMVEWKLFASSINEFISSLFMFRREKTSSIYLSQVSGSKWLRLMILSLPRP